MFTNICESIGKQIKVYKTSLMPIRLKELFIR